MGFVRVVKLEELWSGEMSQHQVGGVNVVLIREGEQVAAFLDRCAHMGLPVSCGRLERGILTCAAHEWTYEAATGRGVNPSSARLRPFAVKVEQGEVWVDTEAPAAG